MSKEKVLCIRADQVSVTWTEPRVVLPLSMEDFVSQCCAAGFSFVDRDQAETDLSYKQIIPYLMIHDTQRRKIAAYLRKGSEKRLHDLWSMGIGGHINSIDAGNLQEDFYGILMAGMQRELEEELISFPREDTESLTFCGVISENVTEVGRVHLGALFSLFTEAPEKYVPGEELVNFQWVDSSAVSSMTLESWSFMGLELLSRINLFK